MKAVTAGCACVGAVLLMVGAGVVAQERPATPTTVPSTDPRVGLKPGLKNAGWAARNLELVSSLPKPRGFFDPRMPAGEPTEPESGPKPDASPAPPPRGQAAASRGSGPNRHSTSAFSGHLHRPSTANVYDLADPKSRKLVRSSALAVRVTSGARNLLVMSVEQMRGRLDCGIERSSMSAPSGFVASVSSTSPT